MTETPYRFDRSHQAAALHHQFDGIDAGAETGEVVSVAGRVMLHRHQGKLDFAELRDSSGSIQLFAGANHTTDFDGFTRLSLGDWVGATGEVMKTRRGELSVRVSEWVLLAEARHGFGDKWRGVTDVDTRYRQREVDLWANESSRRVFALRSRMVSLIRRQLEERGFVEVEGPTLQLVPSGGHALPFRTHHNALDLDLFLRIALELPLKRLVIGGFERVFEIGRVFRNEGISPRHNPEFTMLELYEAYADYTDMMELTESLVSETAAALLGTTSITYQGRALDLGRPWRRATLTELVAETAGLEVDLDMGVDKLREVASAAGVPVEPQWGPGKVLLEIYEKTTEHQLWGPVFVCDYPQEVSPLARSHRSRPGYVERFEAIVAGRELANAFSELNDPDEQRARFEEQVRERAAGDAEAMPLDADYLRAMEQGLPPTGGLGVGIDRLAMLLADVANIRDVILFPTLRPEA
ncbi:MAG TPA: lysine--tRNA ligase [Acidimicrobiales bacterium]|nr:lysine--tRNA ligase [Acidimicrobiales bacterium]